MPAKSPLKHCQPHIKADLLKQATTTTKSFVQLSAWLEETHGIKLSDSAIHRFVARHKNGYETLIALGLSPDTIAAQSEQVEELKNQLLYRELTQHRIEELVSGLLEAETDDRETTV